MSRQRLLWRLLGAALALTVVGLAAPPLFRLLVSPHGTANSVTGRRVYSSDPGPWTWRCESGRCVRALWQGGPQVSLDTCQWTCAAWEAPLWPRPTGALRLANSSAALPADLDVRLRLSNPQHEDTRDLLAAATERLARHLQLVRPAWADRVACDSARGATVARLTVLVRLDADGSRPTGHLTLDTDEGYRLQVRRESQDLQAEIDARSFFGARHALETLSQLAWWDPVSGCVRMLDSAIVKDAPKFRHRGLMVDTARNFIPLEALQRTVDAMASNKLNTLHWHLTDSTSFPYLSRALPTMARYGAYSPEQVYSMDDVSRLAEFARERGVRLVVELDVPAHAAAGWPTEQVSCSEQRGSAANAPLVQQHRQNENENGPQYRLEDRRERRAQHGGEEGPAWWELCGQPPCGQLPPADEAAFGTLRTLYQELRQASGASDVAHLGGDEVSAECWGGVRGERLWSLWGGFMRRAHRELVAASQGNPPTAVLVWSSELTAPHNLRRYFDPSTHVVQVWGGSKWNETLPVLLAGFRAVVSHVDAWYLDCGWGDFRSGGAGPCGPVATWQTVYSHRPWAAFPSGARSRLLGGEACLWSEKVDDQTLDVRLWPRAAALAERLWSDPPAGVHPDLPPPGSPQRDEPTLRRAYQRLSHHRERLVARGVRAEAMWPRYCHLNPGACF
ncbi:probable beta-hexosaminidase fdl [Schistocerca serialis cubense]|uniref:probable beta-hexosaminidase fdl n=1 Tax=Schistocerca serialis cubense TaxID=2023355 RepID=UPI00214DF3B3|nr:probable beta-hexosaminidase fdl [Schistocerca serialis cubense]